LNRTVIVDEVNTSGVVLTNKQTSWNKNSFFAAVYASFSVPTPALPYGVTYSPPSSYGVGAEEYSLVGIDGLFAARKFRWRVLKKKKRSAAVCCRIV
jgi:hypothetical protein